MAAGGSWPGIGALPLAPRRLRLVSGALQPQSRTACGAGAAGRDRVLAPGGGGQAIPGGRGAGPFGLEAPARDRRAPRPARGRALAHHRRLGGDDRRACAPDPIGARRARIERLPQPARGGAVRRQQPVFHLGLRRRVGADQLRSGGPCHRVGRRRRLPQSSGRTRATHRAWRAHVDALRHLLDFAILLGAAWLFIRDEPPAWQRAWLIAVALAAELAWPLRPLPVLLAVAVWFVMVAIPHRVSTSTSPAAA